MKDLKKFNDQFEKEFMFLYDHDDNVAGYDEAVEWFDEMLHTNESFKKFVGSVAKARQDLIASDREAAAFAFACEVLGLF